MHSVYNNIIATTRYVNVNMIVYIILQLLQDILIKLKAHHTQCNMLQDVAGNRNTFYSVQLLA